MIGIMLAGGSATRLPNKPLLPTKDGYPVCLSGLDYLKRCGVSHSIVVVPPDSPLVDAIEHFRPGQNFTFVYQPDATGVGHALNMAFGEARKKAVVVVGDNVYPEDEQLKSVEPHLAIRRVPAWRRPHLVSCNGQGELSRSPGDRPMPFSLTTPWVLAPRTDWSPEVWRDFKGIRQEEYPEEGWWDIGTPSLYAAYWRQP